MSSTTVSTLIFLTFQHCILFVQLNLKSVLWFRQGSWNLTLWRLPAQSLSHVQPFVTPWTVAFPPGSSVHGIFQVRILKWVSISYSRGSSQSRHQIHISCIAGGSFTTEPPGKLSDYKSKLLLVLKGSPIRTSGLRGSRSDPLLTAHLVL